MLENKIKSKSTFLWITYALLLLGYLSHTVWWFSQGQNTGFWGNSILPLMMGVAVEIGVLSLTKLLVNELVLINEQGWNNRTSLQQMFTIINIIALVLVAIVSCFANFSHAVEFMRPMKIFEANGYGVDPFWYHLLSGAILPVMSLCLALTIAGVEISEHSNNLENEFNKLTSDYEGALKYNEDLLNELNQINAELNQIKNELNQAKQQLKEADDKLNQDSRFGKLELDKGKRHLITVLFDQAVTKKDRILAAKQLFPDLDNKSISLLCDSSSSMVTQTLNGKNLQ